MAAKRKGGLKLNAICAKLSRQVVYDGSSQNADGDQSLADNSERGSSHYDEGDRPDSDFSEGLTLGQSLEDDQKRREAIEKWVNGEYADDPASIDDDEPKVSKANGGEDGPPEGVYMVQPKGCSDDEDNGNEAEAMPMSHEGSYHDDRDSDSPQKETSFPPSSETPNCQASFTSPGEASALRDYAANTMTEFLHMFGYEEQQGRDELAKKISFEKMKAATSDPSSLTSEEATRRARFSKYEEYIRKLKVGEALPWPMHTNPEELDSKITPEKSSKILPPSACLPGTEAQMFSPSMEHKQAQLSSTGINTHNLASRASKYDFFIQKLKMGESLTQQNGNAYKRPSKYDLENVKYLHLFKPGEGNPDMGGAIAFKTGKVGRPSKYDIRNIQKLLPGKGDSPMMPGVLSSTPATPGTPVIPTAASAGAVGPPCLPVDQGGHMGFNTDYMKSSFSKTDSITTGTVSSAKNGHPVEKPVTEDVNVYQKYIARSLQIPRDEHQERKEGAHNLRGVGWGPCGRGGTDGNGQHAQASRFNPVHVKQEPMDGNSGPSHESMQEHSLDLSKKDHGNESNGHPAPGNPSPLSSLMNKMSQVNPGFFSALNLKSELESSQAADSSDAAQYLSRLIKRPVPEKPIELWKTYLRRYDTDEVCDAQCDFLHKVHFHCLVEDCGALFSTLDGAIKHSNFHFRANLKVKPETAFNEAKESSEGVPNQLAVPVSVPNTPPMDVPSAAVSGAYASSPSLLAWKQLTGSIPPLPASMPNMAASSPLATTSLENAKPQVKPGFLQFQDNDPCLATDCKYSNKFHFHCLFGNCKYVCKTSGKAESHCLDHINPNNNLVNVRDQFAYYSLQCLCPNQQCEFRMRGHYHCLRQGCYFVTNITTKLPWHVKKHEKAERRAANGFKYFTKREECGRLGCKYNQVNSHFHCIREGCMFSFLLKHQMTSHARKHMRRMLGKNFDRVPSQVIPPGHQTEEMQHMASMTSSDTMGTLSCMTSSFSNMTDENDDYLDYMAGESPLGLSSESSNQDRSCTSTPVGNDSSPAGPGSQVPALTTTPTPTTSTDTPPTYQSAPPPHTLPPPPPPPPSLPQAPLQSQPPSFPPSLLRPPLPSLPYLLSPSCISYSLLSASLGATRSVVMPTNTPAFSPIIATPSPVKNDVPIVQDAAGTSLLPLLDLCSSRVH
ncbi:zinc finger protein castor homolog 1 isoform X4 [Tachysurus ichikawai]